MGSAVRTPWAKPRSSEAWPLLPKIKRLALSCSSTKRSSGGTLMGGQRRACEAPGAGAGGLDRSRGAGGLYRWCRRRRAYSALRAAGVAGHDWRLARCSPLAERQELGRLRRKNRQIRMEREILSEAAAWFARETGSIPSKGSNS
jgi:hypothetical protein